MKLFQGRKNLEYIIQGLLSLGGGSQIATNTQIFHNRALFKNSASFRAKDKSFLSPLAGFEPHDFFSQILNFSHDADPLSTSHGLFFSDILDDTGKHIHQGGFSGTVGSKYPNNLMLIAFYTDIIKGQHVFVKDH